VDFKPPMKTMSRGNTEAGGGHDGDHIIGGQRVGGEHRSLRRLERDHGLNDLRVGLQGAIHSAGAATTGHAGDGQIVGFGSHSVGRTVWDFNPFSRGRGDGMLCSCRGQHVVGPQISPDRRLVAGFQPRKMRELPTTLTEDNDIAAAAKAGGRSHPVHGNSTPIAKGKPMRL